MKVLHPQFLIVSKFWILLIDKWLSKPYITAVYHTAISISLDHWVVERHRNIAITGLRILLFSLKDSIMRNERRLCHEPQTLFVRSDIWGLRFLLQKWKENYFQIKRVFLQWLPWILRYSRPNKKITIKSIMIENKMASKISKFSSVPSSPIHQKIHENGHGLSNGTFRWVIKWYEFLKFRRSINGSVPINYAWDPKILPLFLKHIVILMIASSYP